MRKILFIVLIVFIISCEKDTPEPTPNIVGNTYSGFVEMGSLGYSSINIAYKFISSIDVLIIKYWEHPPIPGVQVDKYEFISKKSTTYEINYPNITVTAETANTGYFGNFITEDLIKISDIFVTIVDSTSELGVFLSKIN